MLERAIRPRRERAAILAVVVSLHVTTFFVLLSISDTHPTAEVRPTSLALVSLNPREEAKGKSPPPALPSKVADKAINLSPPAVSPDPTSSTPGALGGCATLERVANSLVGDTAAVAAVLRTPPESRSIAEAVVIWNAGWSDTARDLTAPLGPARAALEQSLESIPAECLAEEVAGPRLVPVPAGEGRTMFVVIGSGTWSWGQLLVNTSAPVDAPPRPTPAGDFWDWLSRVGPS